jgi:Sel1 repeat-containing protein
VRAFCLILVFVLAPSVVQAQAATADGVRALARGDYAMAAQILQPLADDERQPDAVAAFFLAALHQSGHGVSSDPIRACGLYLRAAAAASPLRAQADTLARTVHRDDPVMMRLCASAGADPSRHPSAGVALSPLVARQSSTDVAVDAYVSGDAARAAEILKPLVESWPSRDHVAEFLMATLYENGAGIVTDTTRACALYVRAGSDAGGPFGRQATELSYAMRASQTPQKLRECNLLASIGFDHGFRPVTFELESGHWIALDLEGATISYGGRERRIERPFATPGVLFLPIEHTELTVGAAERRHFIELFRWLPAGERTWRLVWDVFEATRDDLVPVTTQELATAVTERSSLGASADPHALTRLSIDNSGRAQWAVLGGVTPGTGQIESDSDRRGRAEQARARAVADARVDWTAVRDLRRAPQLSYSDADGCWFTFVYGWSADRTEAITIQADKDLLGLSTTPRTFQLASASSTLQVAVHVFGRARRSWPFCTDVGEFGLEEETWKAVAGTVTIELSPTGVDARVRIVGAEFLSTAGVRVKQVQPIVLSARVARLH